MQSIVFLLKIGLLATLRTKFCRQQSVKVHVPWLPETYDLEIPADCVALLKENEVTNKLENISSSDAGKYIFHLSTCRAIFNICFISSQFLA